MAKVGLYFGSFNPIHMGHLVVAQHMLNEGPFEEIWFVVSPQNPFKESSDLLPEKLRFEMVKAATADNLGFRALDVEFRLPLPSYSIQTIQHLQEKSSNDFSIIMGADNLERLHEWKDISRLAELVDFHVYNRTGSKTESAVAHAQIQHYQAPLIDLSATTIREMLQSRKCLRYLVPDTVRVILQTNGFSHA